MLLLWPGRGRPPPPTHAPRVDAKFKGMNDKLPSLCFGSNNKADNNPILFLRSSLPM